MQTFILSDVRHIAYRLLASGGQKGRRAWSGLNRSKNTQGLRLRVHLLCLFGVMGALVFMSGCQGSGSSSPNVLAEVNGHPIYRSQVERIYLNQVGSKGEADDKEEDLTYKLSILNELINNKILTDYATRSGITVPESDVDTKVSQIESPYSKQQFDQFLKKRDMTRKELRRQVQNSLILNRLINRDINSRVSVSDEEIAAYYKKNKSSFDVPETEYHLAQIEVTPWPTKNLHNLKNDDAKTPEMAQQKIRALYAQLKSGHSFSTIAEDYSEDPATASSGGDMGFVPESALSTNPALEKVVKSLKVGQISGIINTRSGYHILKLLGIEHAGQRPLSDAKVQSRIRETLLNEKEQLLKAAFVENLRDHAKVKNFLAERIVKSTETPKKKK